MQPVAQVVVHLMPDMTVQTQAQGVNEMTFRFMLEKAKEAGLAEMAKQKASPVVVAQGMGLAALRQAHRNGG